jgi:MFS transporter, DHA1 family, multidrug resistance protein
LPDPRNLPPEHSGEGTGSDRPIAYRARDELEAGFAPAEETVEPTVAALEFGEHPFDRPTRGWTFVFLVGGLTALAPLSIDMYLPGLPDMAVELGGSVSGVQLSLTACLAGLALGQLVAGPLSDRYGRRPPLVVGLAGFAVASVLCAFAPNVPTLVLLRLLQGLFGAAGLVISRAIVRDLYDGVEAVKFFSLLMLVTGMAPILAPLVGVQILHMAGWRTIFIVLGAFGVFILAGTLIRIPETHPPARRRPSGILVTVRRLAALLRDRSLLGYALTTGFSFAAMFAYIAGSPFVVQNVYGASPLVFSLVFGANAIGMMIAAQINGRLAGRIAPGAALTVALFVMNAAGLLLVAVVLADLPQLFAVLVPLFVFIATLGIVMPNATALAMSLHPEAAGSASALLGVLQFIVGAAAAPLVGLAGPDTAVPMAVVMAVLGISAFFALALLTGKKGVPA